MQKMELYSLHYWPTLRGIVVLVISKSAGEKEKMLFDLAKVEQNNFKFSTHAKKIKIKIITNAVFKYFESLYYSQIQY